MNLYLILRPEGDTTGWDEYYGAVVCAKDSNDAQRIRPTKESTGMREQHLYDDGWILPMDVRVIYIGEANTEVERGIILSSFHAS